MNMGKKISGEDIAKATGGVGMGVLTSALGLEHYPAKRENCPICGSDKPTYKTFTLGEGTGKMGQQCESGHKWTFGDKTGIL